MLYSCTHKATVGVRGLTLEDHYSIIDSIAIRLLLNTFVRTAYEASSHANAARPLERVKSYVASDER